MPENSVPINVSLEPMPPTLAELANACEAARAKYRASKSKAGESAARAKEDADAREQAHAELRSAIFVLDNAAKAEDPDPA